MPIKTLFDDFCHYAKYIRGVSPDTIKRYRQNVSYFLKFTEIECIQEVTQGKVLSFFMYGRVERNWKPTTYRTFHMSLLVFFRWCVRHGHLEMNHAEPIELPRMERTLPKGLSKLDAEKLLEVVYNYPYTSEFQRFRNHAIFATFIFSGLRRSELINLRFTDVDVENRTIFVSKGKGNKDRYVPMCSTLAQILDRYVMERTKEKKTCSEFFTSSVRNTGLRLGGLLHIVKAIKKASGIKFGCHALRHTFATLMLEGGCDIFSLSKMLGHSDIRITTVYMFASKEHLREQAMKHPMNI